MSINPYASPAFEPALAEHGGYRKSSSLVMATAIIFLVNIVGELLSTFWFEPYFSQQEALYLAGDVTDSQILPLVLGALGAGCSFLLIFVIGVVLFCIFLHRAHRNTLALGITDLSYSTGWTIASFFIPVVNLFAPYVGVREIYQASDPAATPDNWREGSASAVTLWWAIWILQLALMGINVGLVWTWTEYPMAIMASRWLDITEACLLTLNALIIINIMYDIERRQALRAARQHPTSLA